MMLKIIIPRLKISNAALRFRPPDAPPPAGAHEGRGKPGEHLTEGTERTVYVLRNPRPSPVQIKTGISDGIFTEVLDGLKEGDRVLLAPPAESKTTASSESGLATNQVNSTNGSARKNGSSGGERGTRKNGL